MSLDHEVEGTLSPSLKKIHFEKVAKASKDFDQYLEETVGSAGNLAMDAHERCDSFDENDIAPQVVKKRKKAKEAKLLKVDDDRQRG